MTQYACFDGTKPDPKPILGWYDTGVVTYPSMPPASDLLALTAAQWAARLTGIWAVSGGELVSVSVNPLIPLSGGE